MEEEEEEGEGTANGNSTSSKKRPRGQPAAEEEGKGGAGGEVVAVDAATNKALAKAAIGIVKKVKITGDGLSRSGLD